MTSTFTHTPVLLAETIAALRPVPNGRYIDATIGGGGHAEKVLELSGPEGMVLGFDADPIALQAAGQRLRPFGRRVMLEQTYFDHLGERCRHRHFEDAHGILFDLGVSSPQLDTAERGFSFQQDAALDMRLGPDAPQTAAQLVNTLPAEELRQIFYTFGEERYARQVAQRIDAERQRSPIESTAQLAAIVARAKPGSRPERIHPATRVFQALRIAVNDELGRLQRALPQAVSVVQGGGRLVLISFHSLEDRIVKRFLRHEAAECVCPPGLPVCICRHQPSLRILTPRPLVASRDEVMANPRARSAKLRAAERIAT
ncbi:MAG: 16S rRNA (cytosine(1402)-N(4))-methyltransferase RsmH [Chloroflexota bacterium]|nr:16S rRNA (cytosine(1402)-N(4))-methyltransferase RsmH [Chloroflexota bacterium]